jgi:hypothetical protein
LIEEDFKVERLRRFVLSLSSFLQRLSISDALLKSIKEFDVTFCIALEMHNLCRKEGIIGFRIASEMHNLCRKEGIIGFRIASEMHNLCRKEGIIGFRIASEMHNLCSSRKELEILRLSISDAFDLLNYHFLQRLCISDAG